MWFAGTLVGQIFHVPTGPSSTHVAKTILAKDEYAMRTMPYFTFTHPITVGLGVELPQTDCTMPSALVNLNNAMKGRSGLPDGSRFVVLNHRINVSMVKNMCFIKMYQHVEKSKSRNRSAWRAKP